MKISKLLCVCLCYTALLCSCSNNDNTKAQNAKPNIESSTTQTSKESSQVDAAIDISSSKETISVSLESDISKQTKGALSQSSNKEENVDFTKPNAEKLYKKCIACHGKNGKSIAPGSVGGVLIANLSKKEISTSLKGFRAKTLSKGGNSAIMYMQTKLLRDEDIEALADYINTF